MSETSAVAVFPIRYRVVASGIEPDFVTEIARHMTIGVDDFRFPTSSRDFVIKVMTCIGLDLADMKGSFPIQFQRAIRIPLSETRMTPGDEDGGFWAIDRRHDLKSNLAHI